MMFSRRNVEEKIYEHCLAELKKWQVFYFSISCVLTLEKNQNENCVSNIAKAKENI